MNDQKAHLLAVFSSLNPILGLKKWNLDPVDDRTQRRWFSGEAEPSVGAVKAVAQEIWRKISPPAADALRAAVFASVRSVVPNAPCEAWTEPTLIAWFVGLVEDAGTDLGLSAVLDVEAWVPERVRFASVQEPGVIIRRGARVRIRAVCKPQAYLHLVWIGSDGEATPLYPWKPGHWDEIGCYASKDADPLPVGTPGYWEVDTAEGLESVVVGASREPIDLETLRGMKDDWSGLARRVSVKRAVVTGGAFEWRGQPGTFRLNVNPKGNDLVSRRHETVAERMALYFPYIKILSFANHGDNRSDHESRNPE